MLLEIIDFILPNMGALIGNELLSSLSSSASN